MLLLLLSAEAQTPDFTYTNNSGTITITEYNGSGGEAIIPSTINGLPANLAIMQPTITCQAPFSGAPTELTRAAHLTFDMKQPSASSRRSLRPMTMSYGWLPSPIESTTPDL